MSILIRGIDMPKKGEYKPLFIYDTGEVTMEIRGEEVQVATAVPVPPHGDLIDRREAIIDANERAYDFWLSDDETNATIQFLNEQTAIIPADEEGAK